MLFLYAHTLCKYALTQIKRKWAHNAKIQRAVNYQGNVVDTKGQDWNRGRPIKKIFAARQTKVYAVQNFVGYLQEGLLEYLAKIVCICVCYSIPNEDSLGLYPAPLMTDLWDMSLSPTLEGVMCSLPRPPPALWSQTAEQDARPDFFRFPPPSLRATSAGCSGASESPRAGHTPLATCCVYADCCSYFVLKIVNFPDYGVHKDGHFTTV